jgi:hypothetical protein
MLDKNWRIHGRPYVNPKLLLLLLGMILLLDALTSRTVRDTFGRAWQALPARSDTPASPHLPARPLSMAATTESADPAIPRAHDCRPRPFAKS